MSEKTPPEAGDRVAVIEDLRPWGKFRRYPHENAGSIKIITVEPRGRLSLQCHEGRAELWVVLDAGLEITVGERVWLAAPNEEIVVPRRIPHRVRNVGPTAARFMEIWIGHSTEDDIVRLADDYDRK